MFLMVIIILLCGTQSMWPMEDYIDTLEPYFRSADTFNPQEHNQLVEQHVHTIQIQDQLNLSKRISIPSYRTPNDYIKEFLHYKKRHIEAPHHALIEDGLLIELHANNHASQYQCVQCDTKFKKFYYAQQHSAYHLGLKFNCDMCDFSHSELDRLTKHMRKEHYMCCQNTFDSQEALDLHLTNKKRVHNLHVGVIMPELNQQSTDNQTSHRVSLPEPPAEDVFQPTLEDYIKPLLFYTNMGQNHPLIENGLLIELHVNQHARHYQCTQCQKTFKHFSHAQRHSFIHFGIKFKCDKCTFHATELHGITKHMQHNHLICCEETFISKEALGLHLEKKTRCHNLHVKPVIPEIHQQSTDNQIEVLSQPTMVFPPSSLDDLTPLPMLDLSALQDHKHHVLEQIPEQPSEDNQDNEIDIQSHRQLEDYIKPLRFYTNMSKNHPLIEDGFFKLNEYGTWYQCTKCTAEFKYFTQAQRHSFTHLGLRLKCDTCSHLTNKLSDAVQHMRKKHRRCCQKNFTSQKALAEHCAMITRNHHGHIKPISLKKINVIPSNKGFINL